MRGAAALSAKEIGYLKDHFIESVTENWCYFRFSPNLDPPLVREQCFICSELRQTLSDGSQDICKDIESNLGPSATF